MKKILKKNTKEEKVESEIFSFDVIEINESSIKIHTLEPYFSSEGVLQDFVIEVGEQLGLATPTRMQVDAFL